MGAAAAVAVKGRIGRFEIIRELGRGAQGTVYLARDPRLEREVAVKTLRLDCPAAGRDGQMHELLAEARIVSNLQHPNIVTLYDAGHDQGTPYLVFEYVEGRTLSALIREKGKLSGAEAVGIARQVLSGIGYAHEKNVVHRDLKPANIILTMAGVPRVMDFGIARYAADAGDREERLYGTPSYMAPEYITTRQYLPASDLFAVGMVLYEMLSGQPAVKPTSMFETLHRMVTEPFAPLGTLNADIEDRLAQLVIKAISKDPKERFESAAAMEAALVAWLEPAATEPVGGAQGTLEFLLRRIRHKSDFPALSATIGSINRVLAADHENTATLCNLILKDFALTTKLLKLVNAAYYSQFGGGVSTVSRAVAIIGFDGIRSAAMSLMLFEHLQNKTQATAMRDHLAATYFSGVLAREFVHKLGIRDAEEAFICSMFHRLGKLLVMFYLPEETQAIERLMQSRGIDENRAAAQVLGISYEDLGTGVAKKWNFPEKIVSSMRAVTEVASRRPEFEAEKLRSLSDLANRLSDVVRSVSPEDREKGMEALLVKYGKAVDLDRKKLASVVEESAKELSRDAGFLGFNIAKSPFFEAATAWIPRARAEEPTTDAMATLVGNTRFDLAAPAAPAETVDAAEPVARANREAALTAGVHDITNTLVSEYELNDVLQIILETMYRGIGFTRVMLLVSDPRYTMLRARFGFGADIDAIVRNGFTIPLPGERDVFYAALTNGADICIEDIDAERIRRHVPDWYRRTIKACGMVLFPIMLKKRPFGLIYADTDSPNILQFQPAELNLLKTLRNQAVLAVRQKT